MKPDLGRARREARRLLASLGIAKPPVDVQRLAHSLGVSVRFADAPTSDLSGFLARSDSTKSGFVIGVNRDHSTKRQRFTIAHELAHFALSHEGDVHVDRSIIAKRDSRSSMASDSCEMEANQFAAELLMPSSWLSRAIQQRRSGQLDDDAIDELAERFEVSVQAMTIRLGALGHLSIQDFDSRSRTRGARRG
jgi:Zn-dependent peptidase ImmA (M78 family)